MKIQKGLLTTALLASNLALHAQDDKKPNLIYVFADQLRADVLGYVGDEKAITPNIDNFSKTAVDFTNAISVCPVSAPHRSSLFTGKYISSTGMVINEINMNPNHRTIAHVLGDAGYNLGYVGKVHLNDQHTRSYPKGPERMGFDGYWAAYSFNHQSYSSYYYTDDEDGKEVKVNLKGKYGPEEFTTLAMNYIEDASKGEEPFAVFLSWNPPHDPWKQSNVLPECYEKFKNTTFELPPNFKSTPDKYMDRFPAEYFNSKTAWKDDFINGGGYEEVMRCYYAMVNSIDEQFGRILSLVDELGIADNTIIVFTSDHGEMFTSQGRMFKLTFYDEAARVPFLIQYPKLNTTGTSDACLNTPDIAPTLLGLMGLETEIPAEMEGDDLSFILRGENGEEPSFALMQGMGHTYQWIDGYEWRSIRDKRYTYAKYRVDGSELLFDRQTDPYMKTNLVNNGAYTSVLTDMRSKMNGKMTELKDEFKACTWYRDNWMYKNFSIKAAAQGVFGPLPPIEPKRGNTATVISGPVSTLEELDLIRNNLSGEYYLTQDIDMSEEKSWIPIGAADASDDDPAEFLGSIDGKGFSIKNLTIEGGGNFTGFIARLAKGASVRNLGMENVNIQGGTPTGGLTAAMFGGVTVENVFVTGSIQGEDEVGGISGRNNNPQENQIINSFVNAEITGNPIGNAGYVGGIIGLSNGKTITMKNVYAAGKLKINPISKSSSYAGGLIGAINNDANVSEIKAESCAVLFDKIEGGSPNLFLGTALLKNTLKYSNIYARDDINLVYADNSNKGTGASIVQTSMLKPNETFKYQNFYANTLGWNFNGIWIMRAGNDYPVLAFGEQSNLIKELADLGLLIYYSDGGVVIESRNVISINIFDLQARTVHVADNISSKTYIPLTQGGYIAQITDGNTTVSSKIIIR